jgi:hypothetical protein
VAFWVFLGKSPNSENPRKKKKKSPKYIFIKGPPTTCEFSGTRFCPSPTSDLTLKDPPGSFSRDFISENFSNFFSKFFRNFFRNFFGNFFWKFLKIGNFFFREVFYRIAFFRNAISWYMYHDVLSEDSCSLEIFAAVDPASYSIYSKEYPVTQGSPPETIRFEGVSL